MTTVPGGWPESSTTSMTIIRSGSTGISLAGDPLDPLGLHHTAEPVLDQSVAFDERVEQLAARPAGFPYHVEDLFVVSADDPASDPRLPAELFIHRVGQGLDRLLGDPALGLLDFTAAAVEGLIQVAQCFGQDFAGRPGGLSLLGLDRPELLDGLAHRGDRGLRLLEEPPAALGLELQLVPKRRELLGQLDQAELGTNTVGVLVIARLGAGTVAEPLEVPGLDLGGFEPFSKAFEQAIKVFCVGVVHGESARFNRLATGSRASRSRRLRSVASVSSESTVVSHWKICDCNRRAGSRSASYAAWIAANRSGARSGGNSRTSSRYRRRISASPASGVRLRVS